jgi:hypothetical protein
LLDQQTRRIDTGHTSRKDPFSLWGVCPSREGAIVDLTTWLPGLALLGLAALGLMFLFIAACEKV